MSKTVTFIKSNSYKIIFFIVVFFFIFIYQVFTMMAIEDRLGDFGKLYYSMNKSNSYLVLIDKKKVGFIEKIEDNIYFSEDKCLINILEFSNQKMEVYKVEPNQTHTNLDINEAIQLKNSSKSELIFKN